MKTKTLYFDCFAGAAGDMLLGALIDLGLDFKALEAELAKLDLADYSISAEKITKQGVTACNFQLHTNKEHTHGEHAHGSHGHGRTYARIREILEAAPIPEAPRARALAAFHRLAVVEAGIHGVDVETVHFHEVGAVDSIVDITGYFLGLHMLEIERVAASPLPVGSGFVQCAHGRMPVPAPATAKLLEGIPVVDNGLTGEVLTPTGALLLGESAEWFGALPDMRIVRVGYGAGDKEQKDVPNVVRAFLGEAAAESGEAPAVVAVLEANVDDMNPELLPHVIEGAMGAGALDAFAIPATGKKGRPGQLITVLAPLSREEALTRFLFRETSTLGVRRRTTQRAVAERSWLEVELPWGRVRVKQGAFGGERVNIAPEYEDCRRLAEASGTPLKEVMAAAAARAREALGDGA